MAYAPIITEALDDVSPKVGEVQYGEYTNDTAPVIRVSLGDQLAAGEQLSLSDNGAAIGSGVTLTAAQIAQGYVDVPVSGLADGWNLISATVAQNGQTVASTPSFALGVATATPASPTITGADDGAAPLADGAHTSDSTPTLHVTEPGLPPPPTGSPGHAPYGGPPLLGGHLDLFEGDRLIGEAMIGFGGAATITTDSLSPGEHTLTAVAVDRAGNSSAPSDPFHLFVDGAVAGQGASGGDLLQASADDHKLQGGAGADTLIGTNAADDVLYGGSGADSIVGGSQANDVNGNSGDDTLIGHSTVGDRLFGGQGQDLIDASGSTGHNLVNGNKGDDTLQGGSGGDSLFGGQGDDTITGGSGADWLSGDRGHNSLTGGGGADTFSAGQGYDRVTDFNPGEGDRIFVGHGLHYEVSQVGADTVLDFNGHGEMVLANVSYSPDQLSGWIIQA